MNVGIVTKTVAPITYYVRSNGNDANAGTTENRALATIQAAIDRIPRFVTHEMVVDIGPGEFCGFLLSSRAVDRGQGGDIIIRGVLGPPGLSSGGTSGIATAGSTTSLADAAQTWTINELRGRLLKVAFDAVTEFRIVRSNTETSIELANPLSRSCDGRGYELVEQKTVIHKTALSGPACIEVRNMVCAALGYSLRDLAVEVDEDGIGVLGNDDDGGRFTRLRSKGGQYGFSWEHTARVGAKDLFAEDASEHGFRFTSGVQTVVSSRMFASGGARGGGIFIKVFDILASHACADDCLGPGIFIWGGVRGDFGCIFGRNNAGSGLKVFGGQAWLDVDYGALENNGRYGVQVDGYAIDDDPSSARGSGSCVNMMANLVVSGNALGGVVGHQSSNIHFRNVRGLNGGYGVRLEHGSKATIEASTAITGELGDATLDGGKTVLSWQDDFAFDGISKMDPETLCLISRAPQSLIADNLLQSPGFETGALAPGWKQSADPPGATTTVDSTVAHGGTYAVKVAFSGEEDVNYFHVTQRVAVESDQDYRVRGYIRAADLTTDNGARLEVQDARGWTYFTAATSAVTGKSDWTYVDTTFTVPADTTEIKVLLRRRSGAGAISGTAWFDDISLYRVE